MYLGGVIGYPIDFTLVGNMPLSNTLILGKCGNTWTLGATQRGSCLRARSEGDRGTCQKARERYNPYGTAPFLGKRPVCRETK